MMRVTMTIEPPRAPRGREKVVTLVGCVEVMLGTVEGRFAGLCFLLDSVCVFSIQLRLVFYRCYTRDS